MDTDYELRPSSPDNMSMMELSNSDEPLICDRCNCNLGDEWWHCGICSDGDYDICQRCSEKKLRCKDDSHDLTKWMGNVYYGNGVIGPGPTDMMLPGNSNRWGSVEGLNSIAQNNWGCVDDSMSGVWGGADSSTNWGSLEPTTTPPDPPNPEATSSSSIHPDFTFEAIDRHLTFSESASIAATPTNWGEQIMTDDTTNPRAAPGTIIQHFANAQEARFSLNDDAPTWTPPSEHADSSGRPTTPSGEYAYVRAAVHSISVGLKDASLAYTSDPTANPSANLTTYAAHQHRLRVEARAWLLFDALKRLHDGGCTLRYAMDYSFPTHRLGGERDRELGFRERWVAVCKLLQRFRSAAGMVASGSTDEVLEAYVAAPLAMGRKMEEDERMGSEEQEWKMPELSEAVKQMLPPGPSSADEQDARKEKKRKLNSEPLTSNDLVEISDDEEMKTEKDQKAKLEHWLKDYV